MRGHRLITIRTGLVAGIATLGLLATACGGEDTAARALPDLPAPAEAATSDAPVETADTAPDESTTAPAVAPETPATVAPEPTPTPSPEPTATPEPTPLPTEPLPEAAEPVEPDCPTAEWTTESIPAAASSTVWTVSGDWNGDGMEDYASTYALDHDGSPWWYLRVDTTSGRSAVITLGDLGVGYAQVSAAVDVDFSLGVDPGINAQELVAIVGSNASGLDLGFFGTDENGCAYRFDDGMGEAFVLPVVATIGQRSGMRCEGAAGSQFVVALNASTADEVTYDTVDTRIERDGTSLLWDTQVLGTLAAEDPALIPYSEAACFGEVLVGGPVDF